MVFRRLFIDTEEYMKVEVEPHDTGDLARIVTGVSVEAHGTWRADSGDGMRGFDATKVIPKASSTFVEAAVPNATATTSTNLQINSDINVVFIPSKSETSWD